MFSFFSVAAFLGVTSGFTVYSHYCIDTAIINHSLIESQATCNHHEVTTCEVQPIHSCCKTDNYIATNSHNSCSDNKEFYKISDVYNINTPSDEEIEKHSYAIISSFVLLNLELEIFNGEPITNYNLPPPLSGKQIVILFHQLKTDPTPIV